jgi:hypothetical protein
MSGPRPGGGPAWAIERQGTGGGGGGGLTTRRRQSQIGFQSFLGLQSRRRVLSGWKDWRDSGKRRMIHRHRRTEYEAKCGIARSCTRQH